LVEELVRRGCEVTVLAEQFLGGGGSFKRIQLSAFFRRNFWEWPRKVREVFLIFRRVTTTPGAIVIAQGDLPRVTYVLLQLVVRVIFIRQDGILTCPGNNRFLRRSRLVCGRRMGLSCLLVHRAEGCMEGLTFGKRVGRVLFRLRDRWLLKCLRHFVVNSRYLARVYGRPARVMYPPLLRSGERLTGESRDLQRMVFCGRLEAVKGADDAVRILSRLPEEYYLEVLGDGVERERLHRLTAELGLKARVKFWGWVDRATRDRVLGSAGVLLLPSLWDEAFGMAGVEAMSMGTPVVAYDVGGVGEWCRGEAGVLVRCGEVAAAAAAVRELTEDTARWEKHSRAARRVAEEFGEGRFGREVGEIYREV
jgi:glycosyltransferase involved in cell wall biosynthesis